MTQKKAGPPPPLDDQLCYALYSAGMAIQRIYKPLLDQMGLTYPQYLVLNVLWRGDEQTVGAIAEQLGLEASTLTPLLKRLEAAGFVQRARNPDNERQVVVALTARGRQLRANAGCLGDALLAASEQTPVNLAGLNREIRALRDTLYTHLQGWQPPT